MSIGPAILRSIFPNRLLGRVIGLNALLVATSTAIAPILGGTLLSAFGWPWLFAINIPLGITAFILGRRVIPNQRHLQSEPFDSIGAVLAAVTLGALVMAANSFAHPGEERALLKNLLSVAGYGATSIVAGSFFVVRQRYAAQPLLPLTVFSSLRFSLAALTSLVSFISQGITFVALPFLFQNIYGYNALESALLFMPWPIGIILAAPRAGRYADRYSPALVSTVGLGCFVLGLVLLALLSEHATIWDIGIRSLICGVGFGCFQSPNNREMLSNVARTHSSYASGILAIMRVSGQCLGTAVVGSILSAHIAFSHDIALEMQAIHVSLWSAFAATAVALVVSIHRLRYAATDTD